MVNGCARCNTDHSCDVMIAKTEALKPEIRFAAKRTYDVIYGTAVDDVGLDVKPRHKLVIQVKQFLTINEIITAVLYEFK